LQYSFFGLFDVFNYCLTPVFDPRSSGHKALGLGLCLPLTFAGFLGEVLCLLSWWMVWFCLKPFFRISPNSLPNLNWASGLGGTALLLNVGKVDKESWSLNDVG
jgi:hypothetical protein